MNIILVKKNLYEIERALHEPHQVMQSRLMHFNDLIF